MLKVTYIDRSDIHISVPAELISGKRHLTAQEISILKQNLNISEDPLWQNVYVDASENGFDPSLIRSSVFRGFIVLGRLRPAKLKYHDLELETGIYRSQLTDIVTGNDNVIRNVLYFENYRLGDRVMLFNIQEMSCTKHSKFGEGILKHGEPEENRIWISVGNENGGRSVLPFESMIPADAYLWSRYRDDAKLMQRFIELTEAGNTGGLDTYGTVGNDAVVKNTTLLKDAKIGACAYIKGAFKLKNITVLSSEDEVSQIGEGVEMVNGIMGYGSRVFYQAVAVRFVIGRNCQLKYGARLLNSVLGDNSTVSCCEMLNNLIFPFHEQHHNSSFLIASTVMGQSNIASGATIGSNHNSRSPDGEMIAERGFWPGLCSDFKHNSRFAAFVLVSKGSYQHELDIPYPFSLISAGENGDQAIHIVPAWWFMYDMFAIVRNKYKFQSRDKRAVKVQHIETDPLAPDTMQEIMSSLDRIINLTALILPGLDKEAAEDAGTPAELYQAAKDFLHQNPDADFTLSDPQCQRKYGATIFKPVQAYKMYRKIVKYFAARTIVEYCAAVKKETLTHEVVGCLRELPLYTSWLNVGGQIIPEDKINELFTLVRNGTIADWEGVHHFYDACALAYPQYKARYALYLLERLYSRRIEEFTGDIYQNIVADVTVVSSDMYASSFSSREKDYTDYYRRMTYRNIDEMTSVLGSLDDNSFLRELRADTEKFNNDLRVVFGGICAEAGIHD
ncbi:MAG TPA: DUF4954 domain-containing protein [Treponema sp.]|nr:DUF4954 domain-containing protein [Treponema sp.]